MEEKKGKETGPQRPEKPQQNGQNWSDDSNDPGKRRQTEEGIQGRTTGRWKGRKRSDEKRREAMGWQAERRRKTMRIGRRVEGGRGKNCSRMPESKRAESRPAPWAPARRLKAGKSGVQNRLTWVINYPGPKHSTRVINYPGQRIPWTKAVSPKPYTSVNTISRPRAKQPPRSQAKHSSHTLPERPARPWAKNNTRAEERLQSAVPFGSSRSRAAGFNKKHTLLPAAAYPNDILMLQGIPYGNIYVDQQANK